MFLIKGNYMSDIWFTSDTHFFHAKSIEFDKRPFKDVEEMNEAIVTRWNEKVKPQDIIYFLGDFSFGKLEPSAAIAKRLNGMIKVVGGNHDDLKELAKMNAFHSLDSYLEVRKLMKSPVVLFHFPIQSWNAKHYGAVHLHGHSHGTTPSVGLRRFDVGSNCWNFTPVNWEEIKALLPSKDEEFARLKGHDVSDPNFARIFQDYMESGKSRQDYE
jgi:calcineurin-like phosphoesterase family protein